MNLHPTLHKALLAGVARVPLNEGLGASPQLNSLLDAGPHDALLWHALAANDLWQRAGYQPPAAPSALAAADIALTDARTCPRAAEDILQLLLRGIHPELLENWLMQAHALQYRVPHACLVALLDMGMQKPALRQVLTPLLDRRGQWLVKQNPAWTARYGATGEVADDVHSQWQLGSLSERCQALQAMRRTDAAAALAALEHEWSQEPSEIRLALLPCLALGLGPDDEPFLERALDDKRKEVRKAAQDLLACLPGSQLQQRCKARLGAIFTLERKAGLMAKLSAALTASPAAALTLKLSISLPEACDKAMKRDGIGSRNYFGMGEKAGWLADLMGAVTPGHWCDIWQLSPAEVVAVLMEQEFARGLLTGLTQAVSRALHNGHNTAANVHSADSGAVEWYVALITGNVQSQTSVDVMTLLLPDLDLLPAELQEQILHVWLLRAAQDSQAYRHVIACLQQRTSRTVSPLTLDMSRMLLSCTQSQILNETNPNVFGRGNFAVLARALDISDLAYAEESWPAADWQHWPLWREEVDNLMETLRFRHAMQRSFLEMDA